MPGGDRTGPWGMGPRTGRGAGFCSGYGMPGFMNRFVWPPFGGRWLSLLPWRAWWFGYRRRSRGRGFGRGFRRFGWR
ncbi:hypothetical protein DRP04_12770 [Archaeoglobales archaeon]|nr:MAG: hypothetical protein DRP04_12770 [Archaeoglobales archaeon]